MAENVNALILPIGADPTQFEKSINDVRNALKSLQKEIDNKPFNLITAEDRANLEAYENTLKSLESNLSNSSKGFDKATESSKKTRTALTNLTLVAQDLPFGFIAIQNNLPNLISSFGQLDTKTNGIKGVLKDLGSQLIGPAGLFLAFSAVTAAVTYAIKEYGSLSNAVSVLFGANSAAVKSQNEFNKALLQASGNTGGQVAKINILVKAIQDENTSQQDRLAAYRELKRINPDIVAGIDEQNLATASSIKLIGENAKAQLEAIKLQVRSTAISKTLDDIEQKRYIANGKYVKAREEYVKIEKKINDALSKQDSGQKLTKNEKGLIKNRDLTFKVFGEDVEAAKKEIADLDAQQGKWYKSLEPTTLKLSQLSSSAEELANNLKAQRKAEGDAAKETEKASKSYEKSSQKRLDAFNKFNQLKIELPQFDDNKSIDKKISSLEKYGNILLDTTKYDFERAAALKEVIEIDKDFAKNLDGTKNILQSIQGEIQSYIGYLYNLREIQKVLAKDINISKVSKEIETQIFIDTRKLKSQIPALVDAIFPEKDYEKFAEAWNKINETTAPEIEDFKDEIKKALILKSFIPGFKLSLEVIENEIATRFGNFKKIVQDADLSQGIIDILTQGLNIDKIYNKAIENLLNFGEYIKGTTNNISKNLRFLQEPLEGLFTTVLEEGKSNWKEFGDAVVKQIKRIAASLLSKALINGISYLLSLLSGGATGLVTSGLKGISTDVLGEFLDMTGGSKINFGGIQGGGMQMSGQVVFVQRGSDLVGVLNRTNGTINRVG